MKISLKSNFDLGISTWEIEGQDITLEDLLQELPQRTPGRVQFLDPRYNQLEDSFLVYLNGQEFNQLPDRLKTQLRNGDEVQVKVIPMGGGV